jgi:hypothetical protein
MDFPPFAMVYHKPAKSPSHAGPRQADEHIIVQALITELAIKAFVVCFLNRFARLDVADLDIVLECPEIKGLTRKFGAIIHSYDFRQVSEQGYTFEHPGNPMAGKRVINFKSRILSGEIINNGQHSEASAIVKTVRNEIHRPMLVGSFRLVHSYSELARTLLASSKTQGETFFTVESLGAFMIDQVSFPAQQDMKSRRAELTPLFSKITQA